MKFSFSLNKSNQWFDKITSLSLSVIYYFDIKSKIK